MPEERHDEEAHGEVDGGHEPRVREVVVDLLVDDVELDVQVVPVGVFAFLFAVVE